jgi:sugar/nucleoside kinase (ribokinase family)
MAEIWTMGEMLCEVMRPEVDMPLDSQGVFYGPFPSGAPAIFIDTAARLQHSAGIISGVGKDDFGKCLLDRLKKDGVDCRYVKEYLDGSTGVAFVTNFSDGTRRFLYHFPETPATRATSPETDDPKLSEAKVFHIMGCSLMAKPAFADEIIKTMKKFVANGAKVSFDPNIRSELFKDEGSMSVIQEVMHSCSVLLPGVAELMLISGEKTVEHAVKKCFDNPVLEVIALKNGSKGCTVYTRTETVSFGVYPVTVRDSTGAGDSFDAAFICGLLEEKSILDATKMATAAASLNTAAFGPMEGEISIENIEKMMQPQK